MHSYNPEPFGLSPQDLYSGHLHFRKMVSPTHMIIGASLRRSPSAPPPSMEAGKALAAGKFPSTINDVLCL
jgi:hypothetical protein